MVRSLAGREFHDAGPEKELGAQPRCGVAVCLRESAQSVSSVLFRTISQKPTQLGSAKLDTETFHDESWKSVYFGVKITSHKKLPACLFFALF